MDIKSILKDSLVDSAEEIRKMRKFRQVHVEGYANIYGKDAELDNIALHSTYECAKKYVASGVKRIAVPVTVILEIEEDE